MKHATSSSARSRPIAAISRIVLPFELAEPSVPAVTLTAVSQGCADVGVCYVPQEQKAELQLAAAGGAAAAMRRRSRLRRRSGARPAPTTRASRGVFAGGFWLAIASFFGFGLLLAFTPCVLPMVPILSGIIVGGGQPRHQDARASCSPRSTCSAWRSPTRSPASPRDCPGAMLVGGAAEPVGAGRVRRGVRRARARDVRLLRAAAAGRAAEPARRREQPPPRRARARASS